MNPVALLTITRPHLAKRARASAIAHGWPLLEYQDTERIGAGAARNRLWQTAREAAGANGWTHAHFLDDDDELTAPPSAFGDADADVVYHNMLCVGRPDVVYTGTHPLNDFMRNGAFVGAMLLRLDGFGDCPFRELQPCMLGSYLWADALRHGRSFQHRQFTAYRYHTDTSPCQLTKRADFAERARIFWESTLGFIR
jgi:hypothetical protein